TGPTAATSPTKKPINCWVPLLRFVHHEIILLTAGKSLFVITSTTDCIAGTSATASSTESAVVDCFNLSSESLNAPVVSACSLVMIPSALACSLNSFTASDSILSIGSNSDPNLSPNK